MVAIVSTNVLYSRDSSAPAPALHEDGSNYPWRMFFDNNQRIVDADTTGELLAFLIADYDIIPDEEKLETRIAFARIIQQLARGTILAKLTDEETDALTEWEWDILNYGEGDNQDPYGWGDGSQPIGTLSEDGIDEWNSSIPLVLLDTSYAPYTDIISPLSSEGDYEEVRNIIWLRPHGEESFLRSLSNIGYITFGSPALVVAKEVARKN